MNTTITDSNSFYGEYIRKREPVVRTTIARILEIERNEYITRAQMAEGEIQRAHLIMDGFHIARAQPNGFPYSLEGRLRNLMNAKVE